VVFHSNVEAQPDTAWVRHYNGVAGGIDAGAALVVDGSGNAYVAGTSDQGAGLQALTTIKYSSSGTVLWVRNQVGATPGLAVAPSVASDDLGFVYVAGGLYGADGSLDFATTKYTPQGDTVWTRAYAGAGGFTDHVTAMTIDALGYVYVTGQSDGLDTRDDVITIKYSPDGNTEWVQRYGGPGTSADVPHDLAVDLAGNVYVTGFSDRPVIPLAAGHSAADYAFITLKYAPSGQLQWVRTYKGPGGGVAWARAICIDHDGHVCVTGDSYGLGTQQDITTVKYTPDGDTVWTRRYNGPPLTDVDRPIAVAVDRHNNVHVAGVSRRVTHAPFDFDWTTLKYSTSGTALWTQHYNGPFNTFDDAYAMVIGPDGSVYVAGRCRSPVYDLVVVKYSALGVRLWTYSYNGPARRQDVATALALGEDGSLYIAGTTDLNGPEEDMVAIRLRMCPLELVGDLTGDHATTGADIIKLVNFLYKAGPEPTPCEAAADVNCDGTVGTSDIMHLINYAYKKGAPPCAICAMIPGTWSCP